MSVYRTFVVLLLALTRAHAVPSIGINNIMDIPSKLSGIAGFGSKGNGTVGGGTTTVMGSNFGSIIPSIPGQIFGANNTGSNNSVSGIGTNFASLAAIPNKVFGSQNKTGPDSGPGFESLISGLSNAVLGNNKTESENATNTGFTGFPVFGSIASEIPNKVFSDSNKTGVNKTGTENGSGPNTGNGWIPAMDSMTPGNLLGSKPSGGGCKNSNQQRSHTAAVPDFGSFAPGIPKNIHETNTSHFGSNIPEFPEVIGKERKSRRRRCKKCSNHGHREAHQKPHADASRSKRQASLGSLGNELGSGGSSLGSLGSSLVSGNATLVLGAFQVLVKPIQDLPGAGGLTDISKNPQSIITQPLALMKDILGGVTTYSVIII